MVDYIEFEGTKYPVKLAMIALKDFEADAKVDIGSIGEDLKLHALLLWHGIRIGHARIKKDFYKKKKIAGVETEVPVLSQGDCLWILDDCFTQYFDIFIKSMARIADISEDEMKGNIRVAIEEEEGKKKLPLKTFVPKP